MRFVFIYFAILILTSCATAPLTEFKPKHFGTKVQPESTNWQALELKSALIVQTTMAEYDTLEIHNDSFIETNSVYIPKGIYKLQNYGLNDKVAYYEALTISAEKVTFGEDKAHWNTSRLSVGGLEDELICFDNFWDKKVCKEISYSLLGKRLVPYEYSMRQQIVPIKIEDSVITETVTNFV
jgi:hypothetical protein